MTSGCVVAVSMCIRVVVVLLVVVVAVAVLDRGAWESSRRRRKRGYNLRRISLLMLISCCWCLIASQFCESSIHFVGNRFVFLLLVDQFV